MSVPFLVDESAPNGARVVRPVALGVVLSAVGDGLYYLVFEVQGHVPDVSVADIAWIGAYLALAGGRRGAGTDGGLPAPAPVG